MCLVVMLNKREKLIYAAHPFNFKIELMQVVPIPFISCESTPCLGEIAADTVTVADVTVYCWRLHGLQWKLRRPTAGFYSVYNR